MTISVNRPPSFARQVKQILKQFPRSAAHLDAVISGLAADPGQGDRYPGFGAFEVRKVRVGLPEYRLGQGKGLRLIFLYLPAKERIVPLVCYLKRDFGSEQAVRNLIYAALRQI